MTALPRPNGRQKPSNASGLQKDDATGSDADEAATSEQEKRCFVIGPIGGAGTEIRKRSDQILRHIIDPVVERLGYAKALRADRISESGRITQQVIQHITDDELVIADLTGSNPNVYYELALRHALGKPFVQLLAGEDQLPFDIADQRTIMVDHRDLDSVAQAKEELERQIEALQAVVGPIETPLSFSVDLAALRSSDNPTDKTNAEILAMLQVLTQNSRPRVILRGAKDIAAFRSVIESVVTSDGQVTDEDIAALITTETSEEHDKWVRSLQRRMNQNLPVSRGPFTTAEDPWASSAPSNTPHGGFSDEPPF